jgi:hypothetical protein
MIKIRKKYDAQNTLDVQHKKTFETKNIHRITGYLDNLEDKMYST